MEASLLERDLDCRSAQLEQSVTEKKRLDALIWRQERECPRIVEELKKNRRKTSHWAWWVFPTEKPGFSEPEPATAVTRTNAGDLLTRAPPDWQASLELIVDLCEQNGRGLHDILPAIDHPRVGYFVELFSDMDDMPVWLREVVTRLKALIAVSAPKRSSWRLSNGSWERP